MRIAFLADSLDLQYGGIQVYTKELLMALSSIDKKNEYIIIRNKKTGDFKNCEEIAVPYSTYPGYRAWRLFHQLPKIAHQNNVDIVVEPAHFGPFNLSPSIKRVTVIHDLTMFLFPKDHVFASQFLQRKFLPFILRKTDHIITNSKNTALDLCRFFPFSKDKTTPILLGKSNQFTPQKESAAILAKYKITRPFLLCTATLEPRKNIPLLIQAFDDFKSKTGLPYQLVLVGKTGWKAEPIFKAIEQSPYKQDIIRLGYVEKQDLPMLYSAAKVFIYPSKYEGFGLPVLEAMACGTAVITTKISSLPEVGGKAAKYFSPGSKEELLQKMIALCSNTELLKNCQEKSLVQARLFSWEKTAKETIQVFEKLKSKTK
jgi:glycosyltransferase involved in cell wall biosynthesis